MTFRKASQATKVFASLNHGPKISGSWQARIIEMGAVVAFAR
jgi:hypothetical protein